MLNDIVRIDVLQSELGCAGPQDTEGVIAQEDRNIGPYVAKLFEHLLHQWNCNVATICAVCQCAYLSSVKVFLTMR